MCTLQNGEGDFTRMFFYESILKKGLVFGRLVLASFVTFVLRGKFTYFFINTKYLDNNF